MAFVSLLACGAGLGLSVLAQAPAEPPAKAAQGTVEIKPQQYPADWKGRLQGTVTEAHTGKLLAGATISVSLAGVAEEYRLVQATSGADGKYSTPLPAGHAWLFGLYAPPGYYTKDQRTRSQVAAREGQDAVFDFKLYPGMAWNIQFADGPASPRKPPRFIATPDVPPGTILSNGSSLMAIGNLQGKAVITFPRASERYRITSFWPEGGLSRGTSAFLEIDGQFDPQQIVGPPAAVPDGKGQRIKDRAGRIATLEDAEFVVEGQNVTIRMKQKPESKEPNLVFHGKVLDEQNKPVEGAEAILAFNSQASGAMSEYNAKTNGQGVFRIEGPNRSEFRAQRSLNVSAMIRRKGYAGKETEKLLLATAREKGMGDFGAISLKPGLTFRGKVVDDEGKPVHGAVVTNTTNYFLYSHLQCRTDADGHFTMSGLSEGNQSLEVQYGEKSAIVSHTLNEKSDEIKIEVRPRRGMGVRQDDGVNAKTKETTELKKLAWNLTPPAKEPKYQHAPKYSLLVFGRNQETRVWLVLDGEVLYVDCHGNGDLTTPECRITATQGEVTLGNPGFYKDIASYSFDLNKLVGAGKGQMRLDLFRRDEKFVPKLGIDIKSQEQWQENRWGRAIINRKSAGSGLYFVPQPVDAQVTNFDGPLSLSKKNRSEQIFERGSGGSDFPLHIGSFGRPCRNGSYSLITTLPLAEVPEDLHLIARVGFPAKVPGAEPIVRVFELKERCCGDTFHGTVIVPAEAGTGNAKVTVSTSPWPDHEVEQGKFEVPIKD